MRTELLRNAVQSFGTWSWRPIKEISRVRSMLKSLGYHLKKLAGTQAMTSGWSQDKKLCDKPRAWVVRLPGAFMHLGNEQDYTAFQTIVSANSAEAAWEVACMTDVWETLPFQVKRVQVFPRDPSVEPCTAN
tara:strand:- start:174 stop:569 length:396 start_codon:yes stop_codon:yes gene_type:complete